MFRRGSECGVNHQRSWRHRQRQRSEHGEQSGAQITLRALHATPCRIHRFVVHGARGVFAVVRTGADDIRCDVLGHERKRRCARDNRHVEE
jgi:hypothetical protein